MAFADIYDDMEVAEGYLKFCLQYVLENNLDELTYLEVEANRRTKEEIDKENEELKKVGKQLKTYEPAKIVDNLKHVLATPFKRITYTEIIDILLKEEKKMEK